MFANPVNYSSGNPPRGSTPGAQVGDRAGGAGRSLIKEDRLRVPAGGDRLGVQLPDLWAVSNRSSSPFPPHLGVLLLGEQLPTSGWTFGTIRWVPSARMSHWSPSPFPTHPALGTCKDGDLWTVLPAVRIPPPQCGHRASVHQPVPEAAPALGSPARTPSAPPAVPGPRHADHSPSVSGSPTPSPFCHLRTAHKK